ncbi:MAG: nucleotidyltransferase substrate binding protein [Bacteroidota bacterium]|nr:nucleotidyltransferase substrate binding protein [Bacteroidota bacterium]
MLSEDIRWKQRFQNFEKSLHYLEEALSIGAPDIIQRAGLIQFFELSFELGWKVLKDYLEEQGFADVKSPRAAIKKDFETELVTDGHTWLQALEDRNLTTQTYDEETAQEVEHLIRNIYYPLLKELHTVLYQKL